MLRSLLWLPGAVLVLGVLLDLLASSMQTGEGRLLRLIHRLLYTLIQAVAQVGGRRYLAWSGAVLVVGTLWTWVSLSWLGWSLVFWSKPQALVGASTGTPADLWDVLYFVGYTMTTLGLGDLKPIYTGWRLLSDLTALDGFVLITFAISFVVPVAQAQAGRRILALRIHRLGATAQGLLITAWHDHPRGLQGLVDDLAVSLNALDAQLKTTPSLYRFHDARPEESIELALPAFDEALSLIEFALDAPPPKGLRAVRASVSSLLGTYRDVHPGLPRPAPPLPDLAPLRAAGLPVREDAVVEAAFAKLTERRRVLHNMTARGRFSWADVED
ncbi:potassium channel family protein [Deinococcus sp. S9]|uniref:potassium channel family protein n=1 Tax=Deinococcus sp. S9 TaxID=2545754 RepID=UPI001F0EE9E3|nr:potassium channel family protein [Deinococcus sp. S9]